MPCTRKRTSPRPRASSSNRRMNCSPMMRRFCSGSVTPCERGQEPVGGVDVAQRHLEVVVERLDHLLGLVLAQQAVVDEHAGELVADGAVHEQRRHRRVDAARERADDLVVADLLADQVDLLLDELQRRPGRRRLAGLEQEVAQHVGAAGRVRRPRGGTGRRRGRARGPPSPRPAWCRWTPCRRSRPAARTTLSLWLIHAVCSAGRSREEQALAAELDRRLAELADAGVGRPRRRGRRPSPACRSRCRAPARRDRTAPGSTAGAPGS